MNISNLEAFVEQENRFSAIFGSKPLSLMNKADRQRIADKIDMQLSPENLSCDGELSRSQVQKRYTYLTRVARELQSIDPTVTFMEFA
jgi:hypothetical protein